jgi:hypothetical protein
MNWYIAKIVFQIISGEGDHQPQFDEQLRLIGADDEHQALEKAYQAGMQNEDRFINNQKQIVKWQFVDVAEINLLSDLTDGAELYYSIYEPADADNYINWTHHKAALLGRADHTIANLS